MGWFHKLIMPSAKLFSLYAQLLRSYLLAQKFKYLNIRVNRAVQSLMFEWKQFMKLTLGPFSIWIVWLYLFKHIKNDMQHPLISQIYILAKFSSENCKEKTSM